VEIETVKTAYSWRNPNVSHKKYTEPLLRRAEFVRECGASMKEFARSTGVDYCGVDKETGETETGKE